MSELAPNAQYNIASADSIPVRIAGYQRRKMFNLFLDYSKPSQDDTILDVGTTSDTSYDHSNYFIRWYEHQDKITGVGVDDLSGLSSVFPKVRFDMADGCSLPYDDNAFDHVHSSAVLEHVGGREKQTMFVRELCRVSRGSVFMTTPNRWFPIEFHTLLPLAHWLPPAQFRSLLKRMNMAFFADEANLNLMSAGDLRRVSRAAEQPQLVVSSVSLIGWPANLILSGAPAETVQT